MTGFFQNKDEVQLRVYLDDERVTPPGWTRAYTAAEAISLLETQNVVEISLDHDLGNDTKGTGYDVLLWIEAAVFTQGFVPPVMHVHSANASARIKMLSAIQTTLRYFHDRPRSD